MTQVGEGERIVKLMLFIRENGPVTLADIRRRFPHEYGKPAGSEQSTRRRFERDKKTLQDFGIYLAVDDRKRYELDLSKSYSAPVSLTGPQVSLLRLLCGALLEDADYPFKEDLRMVLVKLGDELEMPDMLPQLDDSNSASGRAAEPQGFSKIRKAIITRKRMSFEYSNASGVDSTREVEPFGCYFLRGACYIIAFDPSAGANRCFRVDRMRKIKVNTASPNTPDFEERPFDVSEYYGLPFQFGDEDFIARIRVEKPEVARARNIAMGQGSFEEDDEGCIWTVPCRDAVALARWCIENGPGLRILEPGEAARAFDECPRAFLRRLDDETAVRA